MKKRSLALILAVLLILPFFPETTVHAAFNDIPNATERYNLNYSNITIDPGEVITFTSSNLTVQNHALVATYLERPPTYNSFFVESRTTETGAAQVSIQFIAPGTYRFCFGTLRDNTNFTGRSAIATITVRRPTPKITPSVLTIEAGQQDTLRTNIYDGIYLFDGADKGWNANEKHVYWSSSDESVVSVDRRGNGLIKARAAGTATITAESLCKSYKVSATVTVTPRQVDPVAVTVNPSAASLEVGEQTNITATVQPSNATDNTVTWSTEDAGIARINPSGNTVTVTGVRPGTVDIMARTANGKTGTTTVTVNNSIVPLEGLDILPANVELAVGDSSGVTPVFTPSNASNKNITWISTNPASFVYDERYDEIEGLAPGYGALIAVAEDGGHMAFVNVLVGNGGTTPPVTGGNLALGAVASSNSETNNYSAQLAVDGDRNSRWLSAVGETSCYVELDFGKTVSFNQIKLFEFGSRINEYALQYWDGNNWSDIETGYGIGEDFETNFSTITSAKLRLMIYSCKTTRPSIYEIEVYNR